MVSPRTGEAILVTGASGFVGACLCRYFAARGARVVGLSRPGTPSWRLDGATVELVEVDVAGSADARALVRDVRPSAVIHCAAYGAYSNQSDADRIYQVNFDLVRHLVEALKNEAGFRAFVQAGTSSEYGLNCTAPDEDAATRPDSEYAVSKLAATAFVQYAGIKWGFPGWVLRLYSVYGPYEDASRLVPRLLAHAEEGTLPPLVHPDISRDFVFVDDVCAAFEAVLERADQLERGGVFNVGTGRRSTLSDIVAVVRRQFAIAQEPAWGSMADRAWDHADWYANPKKAEKILGWRAPTTLSDGMAKTAAWRKAHPDAVRASLQNVITGAG